jgi:hypothetical protein
MLSDHDGTAILGRGRDISGWKEMGQGRALEGQGGAKKWTCFGRQVHAD